MQIEAGQKYDIVGPLERNGDNQEYPWRNPTAAHPDHRYINWSADGSVAVMGGFRDAVDGGFSIASLLARSPIRTRNEIVPGVYGKLQIGGEYQIPDCSDPGEPVDIGLDISIISNTMTDDEIDAAAAIMTQLAAVLRENQ